LDRVSFSSLTALERCPLQWQLLRSAWPGFERFPARRHPAAVEGDIVHDTLDRVFKGLALRGLPRLGTPEFRAVLRALDVPGMVRRAVDDYHESLATHPRRLAIRLPTDPQALYNRVARLFQAEYQATTPGDPVTARSASEARGNESPARRLVRLGTLTEESLEHPFLPLQGTIDLLRRDAAGTHVVDFKTGHPRPEYREQLSLYALLWWRATGDLPVTLELRHPRGRERWPVEALELTAVEARLVPRIDAVRAALATPPASARPGDHCAHCDVRPFCDEYWARPRSARQGGARGDQAWGDVEVTVPGAVGANGFDGDARDGARLTVVYDDETAAVHGPFAPGERLRVLGVRVAETGEVRLLRGSEVYRRAESDRPAR
jgi:RecB family exonuclease